MGTKPVERGPNAERVAANVRRLREAMRPRMTLDDLSQRMGELGRPILKSGLSKIEAGERRVDVDDLVALAVALEVTPNALLLGPEADDARMALTPARETSRKWAWRWASGDEGWQGTAGPGSDFPHTWYATTTMFEFAQAGRPHDPPIRVDLDEFADFQKYLGEFAALRERLAREGVPDWVLTDAHKGFHVGPDKLMIDTGAYETDEWEEEPQSLTLSDDVREN